MKARIYIDPEGMEALAQGKRLWYWNLSLRNSNPDGSFDEPPKGVLVTAADVDLVLPHQSVCLEKAKEKLEARLQEIRAEAYAQEREIQQRLNDLLMIGYSAPEVIDELPEA